MKNVCQGNTTKEFLKRYLQIQNRHMKERVYIGLVRPVITYSCVSSILEEFDCEQCALGEVKLTSSASSKYSRS